MITIANCLSKCDILPTALLQNQKESVSERKINEDLVVLLKKFLDCFGNFMES